MRNIFRVADPATPRVVRLSPIAPRAAIGALADMLEHPRFEVLPTPGTVESVATHLPHGRMVTVTASPSRGLDPTIDLAVELALLGYEAVPHLAARMVVDQVHLAEIVAHLHQAGVTRIFVPSGDADQAGAYPDAVALLQGLDELGSPFAHVGITGYPESHPTISDDLTVQAMWDKRRYATELVSNLSFDPRAVEEWLFRVRRRGVTLPLWLGVPGPVGTTRLLGIASRIGVGESTRYLLKHRRTVARLVAPGGFSTDAFLRRLAPALTRSDSVVAGLHVFTFNQVAEAEAWRARLLAQLREGGAKTPPSRKGRATAG